MSDTKSLMLSTLPNGYEVVEGRDYEGGECDIWWNVFDGVWLENDPEPHRWSVPEWSAGLRYARKVPAPVVRWESEAPTEPGFYWCKWLVGLGEFGEPTVEEVYIYEDCLLVSGLPVCASTDMWWPIPIQPPKERP